MLTTWNAMIHDDNEKLKALGHLIHELKVSTPARREELIDLEERLSTLKHVRYTEKSMCNFEAIEEYDFASNSLVTELISLAESQTQFSYNTTMQKLVERIRTLEQRIENYRIEHDVIASAYNAFLERNEKWLKETDSDSIIRKPLFEMVASDEE